MIVVFQCLLVALLGMHHRAFIEPCLTAVRAGSQSGVEPLRGLHEVVSILFHETENNKRFHVRGVERQRLLRCAHGQVKFLQLDPGDGQIGEYRNPIWRQVGRLLETGFRLRKVLILEKCQPLEKKLPG